MAIVEKLERIAKAGVRISIIKLSDNTAALFAERGEYHAFAVRLTDGSKPRRTLVTGIPSEFDDVQFERRLDVLLEQWDTMRPVLRGMASRYD